MSGQRCTAEVVYVDTKGQRFSVLVTEDRVFVTAHWDVFRKADVSSVLPGDGFVVRHSVDPRDEQTAVVGEVEGRFRGIITGYCPPNGLDAPDGRPADSRSLFTALEGARRSAVFSNLTIEEPFEYGELDLQSTIVFADCTFSDDFRMVGAKVAGDVWFLNCSFSKHFSLRGSVATGNVVLLGCDFGGAGGISFRGVRCRSIFLDYGVRGSSDMLWLNEMVLKGCVVVNGSFDSKIQFRGRQSREEAPLNHDAEVQRIFIGRNACSSERLGENRYEGGIEFDGYHVKGSIEITDGKLDELIIRDMDFGSLMVDHCRIAGNMSADRIAVSCPERGITVRSCDIEGHLQIGGRSLDCKLVLERTWVGQTWRLELEDPEDGVPKVSLIRFSAGSAVFEPVRLVYGRQQRFHFLRPPDLGMLEGAENRLPRDRRERHQLAEAYTSCKNWLATSGHLREEDHAFFYMRDAREASAWRRFAFGVAFGWGIYLRNIVISALLVVSLFAVAYVSFGLSLGEAAMLSAQSFVASIFGDWPPFSPTGPVSVLATTESLVGILYITVIIGAYIRKLLR